MQPAEPRKPMPQRFAAAPTLDGFEVIDAETGRPMGFDCEHRNQANGIAQTLNRTALGGPAAVAKALRAA